MDGRAGGLVGEDDLLEYTSKIDSLVERLDVFIEQSQQGSTSQTVIHKTAGMGAWGAAAVTACFMTFLAMIIITIFAVHEMHDLRAWSDTYRAQIATLKAQLSEKK